MAKTQAKKPGARTQRVILKDGSEKEIRVRSIDPRKESKHAKAKARPTKPTVEPEKT